MIPGLFYSDVEGARQHGTVTTMFEVIYLVNRCGFHKLYSTGMAAEEQNSGGHGESEMEKL